MVARRRVTLKDVAEATGLSPAAVSYALRGVQTSEATQERVRSTAAELGYTGNAVARALARGRTGVVAVLSYSLQDLGEQRFVEAIGHGLAAHDLQMVVADAGGDPEQERRLARQLADQLVDGLIVSPLDPSAAAWEELGAALPVVSVGDALAGPTAGEVLFDDHAGVRLVLEHLHGLGHRHLAVLTPSRTSTPDRPAELVVTGLSGDLGMTATVVNTRHSIEGATESADALLAGDGRPTAVFCLSDTIACGVYAAAAMHGLRVPEDVAVAGYDNHPVGSALSPALTSVEWGMADVAGSASDLLAAAVEGRPRRGARAQVRVTPRLVVRASTG